MTMITASRFGLATLIGFPMAPAHGDPSAGRIIADRWCASCHIVSAEQVTGVADIRTFQEIAMIHGGSNKALETYLMHPHPKMADVSLTRREIRDLVAYIASLR